MIERRRMLIETTPPKNAIYWMGNECVDFTGGIAEQYPIISDSYWGEGNRRGSLTKNAQSLHLSSVSAFSIGSIGAVSVKPIDITNFSKLRARLSFRSTNANYGVMRIGFLTYYPNPFSSSDHSFIQFNTAVDFIGEKELDIANATGEWFFFASVQKEINAVSELTIDRIWLE